MTREEEILELCNSIVKIRAIYEEDAQYREFWKCPFCENTIRYSTLTSSDLIEIEHDINCIYLIAKGLLTKS